MFNSFIPMVATFTGLQLALPSIMEDFDVPVTTAVWVLIGNSIALTSGTLALGGLSRHFERRSLIVVSLAFDVLVMLFIFFTHNIYLFILCRFFQGIARILPWHVLQ